MITVYQKDNLKIVQIESLKEINNFHKNPYHGRYDFENEYVRELYYLLENEIKIYFFNIKDNLLMTSLLTAGDAEPYYKQINYKYYLNFIKEWCDSKDIVFNPSPSEEWTKLYKKDIMINNKGYEVI